MTYQTIIIHRIRSYPIDKKKKKNHDRFFRSKTLLATIDYRIFRNILHHDIKKSGSPSFCPEYRGERCDNRHDICDFSSCRYHFQFPHRFSFRSYRKSAYAHPFRNSISHCTALLYGSCRSSMAHPDPVFSRNRNGYSWSDYPGNNCRAIPGHERRQNGLILIFHPYRKGSGSDDRRLYPNTLHDCSRESQIL